MFIEICDDAGNVVCDDAGCAITSDQSDLFSDERVLATSGISGISALEILIGISSSAWGFSVIA